MVRCTTNGKDIKTRNNSPFIDPQIGKKTQFIQSLVGLGNNSAQHNSEEE